MRPASGKPGRHKAAAAPATSVGDVPPPWTLVASGGDQLQAFADRMLLSSAAADKAVGDQVGSAGARGPTAGVKATPRCYARRTQSLGGPQAVGQLELQRKPFVVQPLLLQGLPNAALHERAPVADGYAVPL